MNKPRRTRGKSSSAPSYRLHKSTGQAVVCINGKDLYLGKHGTEESQRRYKQALSDHWSPPGINQKKLLVQPKVADVTIARLVVAFGKKAINKHGEDSNEWKYQVKPVLASFRECYGDLLASEFGPIRFENFRLQLVARGLCRQVIKRKSNYIVKIFELGKNMEIIPAEYWWRLKGLGPVEANIEPRKKRRAVPLGIVKRTQQELTPVLSDLVEVHRLIGGRPTEVCTIRPCDIERSDDVWIYTPATHKTEHHDHSRQIAIGPQAQAVLLPYLERDSQAYCFTPQEAYEQHYARRHENRKTPLKEGNRPRPRKPKTFKPCYNKDSYRRAVKRAAMRAFPIPEEIDNSSEKVKAWKFTHVWTPNQLRKSAAMTVRKEADLETAQVVLGHASKKTTEQFYAEVIDERAVKFARKFG